MMAAPTAPTPAYLSSGCAAHAQDHRLPPSAATPCWCATGWRHSWVSSRPRHRRCQGDHEVQDALLYLRRWRRSSSRLMQQERQPHKARATAPCRLLPPPLSPPPTRTRGCLTTSPRR